MPAFPELATAWGASFADLQVRDAGSAQGDGISQEAVRSLAGNGLHVPSCAAVVLYSLAQLALETSDERHPLPVPTVPVVNGYV